MSEFYRILITLLEGTWGHLVQPPAWSGTAFPSVLYYEHVLYLSPWVLLFFFTVVPQGLVKLHMMQRHFL